MEDNLWGMSPEFWAQAAAERAAEEAAAAAAAAAAVGAWIDSGYDDRLHPFDAAAREAAEAEWVAREEERLENSAAGAWYDDAQWW